MPCVSVLVPCYNVQETLDDALESLLQQTLSDFEVILVDDGSTDKTPEMVQAWTIRDQRFLGFQVGHQGIIHALNFGLHHCRAPLIARFDADDINLPTRLEKQVDFMEANPELALVACQVRGISGEPIQLGLQTYIDWQNGLLEAADIATNIFVESPFTHPSVMIRKYWLQRVGGYQDHGWPEDYDLWMRLVLAGANISKLPEVLVEWRDSSRRLTRSDPRYSGENFLRAKVHYLKSSLLKNRDAILIWGAGQMGHRFGKLLLEEGIPIRAYFDVDPYKIGQLCWSIPIYPPEHLQTVWKGCENPILLVAVGTRGAKPILRQTLSQPDLREGENWWFVT